MQTVLPAGRSAKPERATRAASLAIFSVQRGAAAWLSSTVASSADASKRGAARRMSGAPATGARGQAVVRVLDAARHRLERTCGGRERRRREAASGHGGGSGSGGGALSRSGAARLAGVA